MQNKFEAQEIGYIKGKGIVDSQFGGQQLKISLGGGKTSFPLVHGYLDIDKLMNMINNPDEVFADGADFKLASLGKATKLILNGGNAGGGFKKPAARTEYRPKAAAGYQKRTGDEMEENSPY